MAKDYVERRHDSFYVAGTRVPLARIVWEFRNRESAETIRAHFPVLTLEEVYGSITFYLANKDEAEKDLSDRLQAEDEYSKNHPCPPDLKEKFERMRREMPARR